MKVSEFQFNFQRKPRYSSNYETMKSFHSKKVGDNLGIYKSFIKGYFSNEPNDIFTDIRPPTKSRPFTSKPLKPNKSHRDGKSVVGKESIVFERPTTAKSVTQTNFRKIKTSQSHRRSVQIPECKDKRVLADIRTYAKKRYVDTSKLPTLLRERIKSGKPMISQLLDLNNLCKVNSFANKYSEENINL